MAERRMFAKSIIDSDSFIGMPTSTQTLYFHLAMRADDDGFVNNPKTILRMVNCSDDDMKLLIAKQYVIPFSSGIVVIKHWRIHNYIAKDRYKPTAYENEKSHLVQDKNGEYALGNPDVYSLDTSCVQDVYNPYTQDRLGKDSIGKDRLGKREDDADSAGKPAKSPTRHKYGTYQNVLLSDEDYEKLKAEFPTDYTERIERVSEYVAAHGKKYKDFLAVIRCWAKKDQPKRDNDIFAQLKEEYRQ